MSGPTSAPIEVSAESANLVATLPTDRHWIDGGDMYTSSRDFVGQLAQQIKSGQMRYEDVLNEALRIRPRLKIGLSLASTTTEYLTSAEISCAERVTLIRPWGERDFELALEPHRDLLRTTTPDRSRNIHDLLCSLNLDLKHETKRSTIPGTFFERNGNGDSDMVARAELRFVADVVNALLEDINQRIDVFVKYRSSLMEEQVILGRRVIPDLRMMALKEDRSVYDVATIARKSLAAGCLRFNYPLAADEPFIWPFTKDMYSKDDESDKRIIVQISTQMSIYGVDGAILHTLGYQMYFWREYRGTWILYRTNWRKTSYVEHAAFLLFCVRDLEQRRRIHQQASTLESEKHKLSVRGALTGSSIWQRSKSVTFFQKFLLPYWPNLNLRIGRLQQASITRFDSQVSFLYSWLHWLPAIPLQCRVLTNNIQKERSVLLCPELDVIFKVFRTREELLEEAALITFASSKGIAVPKVTGLYTGMLYVLAEEWAGETIPDWESLSSASIVCLLKELEKCQMNQIHHHDLAPRNIVARSDDTVCILDWGEASINGNCHDHCTGDIEIMEGLKELLKSRNFSSTSQPGGPGSDPDSGDFNTLGVDID